MPNLPISLLPEITATTSNAEYAVAQDGVTYKIKRGYMTSGKLFGSFYEQNTISGLTPDITYSMSASTTASNNGITVVDGSKITVQSGGTFNIQFSTQLEKQQGGTSESITIWLRKNGSDVDWSSTDITFANNNQLVVAAWNFVEVLSGGDNLEIMFSVTDTEIVLFGRPSRITPIRPATPSVIITMTQI
jgi:hypothetical protein